ncbi:MAG: metallophosphoesterase family protein [Planctomycetota bacterium]
MRRFAIGDIHGCSKALRTLIEAICPTPEDEVIFLGDYIDRGPDSRDVVDQVIALREQCRVIALRGNHEIMLVAVALRGMDETVWLENGGKATVASYGGSLNRIPAEHIKFFQGLHPYYETEDTIFVHAGYCHLLEMKEHDEATLYWKHLPFPLPLRHKSGKRVIVGHTPQPGGKILDHEHLICIDTYCFGGGYLTAYDLATGDIIQVNSSGFIRKQPFGYHMQRLVRKWKRRKQVVHVPSDEDHS